MLVRFNGGYLYVEMYGLLDDRLFSISEPKTVPHFWIVKKSGGHRYDFESYGLLWNMMDDSYQQYYRGSVKNRMIPALNCHCNGKGSFYTDLDERKALFRHVLKSSNRKS